MEMTEILPASACALNYLHKGFSVVPISPGGKRPLISWTEFQKRRPSKEEVAEWYAKHPEAGVGIVCGEASGGLVVLDVDPRNNGHESLKGKYLPPTWCVNTGGGGRHYYFKSAQPIAKKTGFLPGLDLQAEGALVVAPPSLHSSGRLYEWADGLGPGQVDIAPLPDWILKALAPGASGGNPGNAREASREALYRASEGARHDSMLKLVGGWLAKGTPREEALAMARAANKEYAPPLDDSEVVAIVEDLARKEAAKPQGRSSAPCYTGDFPGLVEIVEKEGRPLFLVKDSGGSPKLLFERRLEDGKAELPPPIEQLPWLLPHGDEAIRYAREAEEIGAAEADRVLFSDLIAYHQGVSELPHEGYYVLLAAFVLHTYLLEAFHYSPILCFYAVPERGKSRTGKGLLYVARRGLHVESLRDAYIIRAAHDLKATLFFDVRALWKKAETANSDDILLHRFERGGKVARVIYPEKGAFRDTVYYEVFGPTLIATNEPLHHILDTRALPVQMPDSARFFKQDVRPEAALPLKERLTAFRLRHLGEPLPDLEKPARGRLGDIARPLLQVIRLASPEHEAGFRELIGEFSRERSLEKSQSFEAQILLAVESLQDRVENGTLALREIVERFNEEKSEREKWTAQRLSKSLTALGFKKAKLSGGRAAILYDEAQLERLKASYGLAHPKTSSPSSPSPTVAAGSAFDGELGEDDLGGRP